jgi:hypothetical protein
MKITLPASLALLTFVQTANAETLMDVLFPKGKSAIAETNHDNLDTAPTGSVAKVAKPADLVTAPGGARPEEFPSYPEAIYWSFQ